MHFWIDTDIGDDIDDILAISWALKKKVDIVGISTVYRQSKERAYIVKELLKHYNVENIPVYAGYSSVLTKDPIPLGKLNYVANESEITEDCEKTVNALIEAVKKYDDLIILIIGSQTNIASACIKAPEIMKKAHFVIMGGAFMTHTAEWNIVCDPLAAKIVSSATEDITYIPWDITRYISIGKKNFDDILGIQEDSSRGFVADCVRQWAKNSNYIPLLHDPSAFYYCLRPDLFEVKKVKVDVKESGDCMGMTLNLNDFTLRKNKEKEFPIVNVVVKSNNEQIISDFMSDVFEIKN